MQNTAGARPICVGARLVSRRLGWRMSRIYWDSMLLSIGSKTILILRRGSQLSIPECVTAKMTSSPAPSPWVKFWRARTARDQRHGWIRYARLCWACCPRSCPSRSRLPDCYARIRGSTDISSPDSIHLACAATAGTDLFLTSDRNLVGKVIPGIQFIAGLDSDII